MDKNIYNPYHPITFIGVKMFLLIGWQFIVNWRLKNGY